MGVKGTALLGVGLPAATSRFVFFRAPSFCRRWNIPCRRRALFLEFIRQCSTYRTRNENSFQDVAYAGDSCILLSPFDSRYQFAQFPHLTLQRCTFSPVFIPLLRFSSQFLCCHALKAH